MKKLLLCSLLLAATTGAIAGNVQSNESQFVKIDNSKKVKVANELNRVPEKVMKDRLAALKVETAETAEAVDVRYRRPVGTYYWAPNPESGTYPYIAAPAYTPLTWLNESTNAGDLSTSSWKRYPTDDKPFVGANLNNFYGLGTFYTPTLSLAGNEFTVNYINNQGTPSNFALATGGKAAADETYNFGFAPYCYFNINGLFTTQYTSYPTKQANLDYWLKAGELASGALVGFCQEFEKPASSYVLSNIRIYAACETAAGCELSLNIYKINDEGVISGKLSTSKLTLENATKGVVDLVFPVTGTDPVTGFETDNIIIDSAIMVEISGFYGNDKVTNFSPAVISYLDSYFAKVKEFNSYVRIDGKDAAGKDAIAFPYLSNIAYYTDDTQTTVEVCSSFMMALEAEFQYQTVVSEENYTDNEFSYTAELAGGVKDYLIASSVIADNYDVSEFNGGDIPDWITFEAKDVEDEGDKFIQLSFNVSAMPGSMTGRNASFKAGANGKYVKFNISQGDGGVHGVEVSAINVATVGDNFVISNAGSATSADVFSVTGQLVKTVAIEGGNATVAADNLAKGIYVFRFNDNTTVKVIK